MKLTLEISTLWTLLLVTAASSNTICIHCPALIKCMTYDICKDWVEKCNCLKTSEDIMPKITTQCGVIETPTTPRISTYIVGGDDAGECELPWTVAVLFKDELKCGGTIVDDMHIVTAAHCLTDISDLSDLKIGVGSSDRRKATRYSLSDLIMYPDHSGDLNDIAVIRLTERIPFSKCARPICMPSQGEEYKEGNCIVAGWGITLESSLFQPFILQKVKIPLVDWSLCNTVYDMRDTQLCAGDFDNGGKDACKTDSGGPLICDSGSGWTLVGVVSSGIGCALPGYPGKYTDVAKYMDWIEYVISG